MKLPASSCAARSAATSRRVFSSGSASRRKFSRWSAGRSNAWLNKALTLGLGIFGLAKPLEEPRARGHPVPFHRAGGNSHHFRRLFDAQPAEVPQLDDLRLAGIFFRELLNRFVER